MSEVSVAEGIQPESPKEQASSRVKTRVSIEHKYRHHKSRHEHYKERYRQSKKYRIAALFSGVLVFLLLIICVLMVGTLRANKSEQYRLQTQVNLLKNEAEANAERLDKLQQRNFELNKVSFPNLELFELDKLIVIDQLGISAVMFTEQAEVGAYTSYNFQLLLKQGEFSGPVSLHLVNEFGEKVKEIYVTESETTAGETETLEGTFELLNALSFSYFTLEPALAKEG